jgi:ribose-phosphate pyrophosphokinase
MKDLIIVGSASENTFVEDIAYHLNQHEDYLDIISLKEFLNTEFCPRFIIDEEDMSRVGRKLEARDVIIVSTSFSTLSRNELAMRNFLIARAAKDNGAERVILLEPDLFYSAQDRGPRAEHGITDYKRDAADFKKFDGQPFSARLYAELLKLAGVDEVVTVHIHSPSVERIFMDRFSGKFHNLKPSDVFAGYIRDSDIVNVDRLVLCAPDEGASQFLDELHADLAIPGVPKIQLKKIRHDERDVEVEADPAYNEYLEQIQGKEVIVVDDMVRTGTTIAECCRLLNKYNPRRILFFVTHFYSSREGRDNMNEAVIDEIVSTSTIPTILNRDMQGRLRHKMVVLRIARWISSYILQMLDSGSQGLKQPLYKEDMSSKNPRWRGKMGPLFTADN